MGMAMLLWRHLPVTPYQRGRLLSSSNSLTQMNNNYGAAPHCCHACVCPLRSDMTGLLLVCLKDTCARKKVKTQVARAQGGASSRECMCCFGEFGGGGGLRDRSAGLQTRRVSQHGGTRAHTTNSSSDATSDNAKHQPDTVALSRRMVVKYKAGQHYCTANVVKVHAVPFCFIWLCKSDRKN